MKKTVAILSFLGSLAALQGAARADALDPDLKLAQGPPVQSAPPAERPYGTTRPGLQQARPPRGGVRPHPYGAQQTRACPPPPFTQLAIAPMFGGTAWIYDGNTLIGRIDPGSGSVWVPVGRAYGVVVTRGESTVWQGHVMATPGTVALAWDQYGAPIVDRAPPPPQAPGACAPFGFPPPPVRYGPSYGR